MHPTIVGVGVVSSTRSARAAASTLGAVVSGASTVDAWRHGTTPAMPQERVPNRSCACARTRINDDRSAPGAGVPHVPGGLRRREHRLATESERRGARGTPARSPLPFRPALLGSPAASAPVSVGFCCLARGRVLESARRPYDGRSRDDLCRFDRDGQAESRGAASRSRASARPTETARRPGTADRRSLIWRSPPRDGAACAVIDGDAACVAGQCGLQTASQQRSAEKGTRFTGARSVRARTRRDRGGRASGGRRAWSPGSRSGRPSRPGARGRGSRRRRSTSGS
jgi:hypothetical protein